jgi:phage terminase Nu1 subunit (DNA packaging protein)
MRSLTFTTDELCALFRVTRVTVGNYVKAGMPKLDRGRFDGPEVIEWLIAYHKTPEVKEGDLDGRQEDAKLKKAQRELRELEFKEKTHRLIDRNVVERGIDKMVTAARARLLSMPTKTAGRVIGVSDINNVKAIIESDVIDALNELSRFELPALDDRALESPLDAAAETDAEPVGRRKPVSQPGIKRRARAVDNKSRRIRSRNHGRHD